MQFIARSAPSRTSASESRLKINFAAPSASRGRGGRRRYRARSFSEIIKEIPRSAILLIDARGTSSRSSFFHVSPPFLLPSSSPLFPRSSARRPVCARLYYGIDCAPRCWHNLTLDTLTDDIAFPARQRDEKNELLYRWQAAKDCLLRT